MARRFSLVLPASSAALCLMAACDAHVPTKAPEPLTFTTDSIALVFELATLGFEHAPLLDTLALESIAFKTLPALIPSLCVPDSTGTSDRNGNGIPEDLYLTFPAARCIKSTFFPSRRQRLQGQIRIQDLGGRWGALVTYTDLLYSSMRSDSTAVTVSGTVELRQTTDTTLDLTNHTTLLERTVTLADERRYDRVFDLNTSYRHLLRVAGAQTPQFDVRELDVVGTVHRVRAHTSALGAVRPTSETALFAITTPVRLVKGRAPCSSTVASGRLAARVSGTVSGAIERVFSC